MRLLFFSPRPRAFLFKSFFIVQNTLFFRNGHGPQSHRIKSHNTSMNAKRTRQDNWPNPEESGVLGKRRGSYVAGEEGTHAVIRRSRQSDFFGLEMPWWSLVFLLFFFNFLFASTRAIFGYLYCRVLLLFFFFGSCFSFRSCEVRVGSASLRYLYILLI